MGQLAADSGFISIHKTPVQACFKDSRIALRTGAEYLSIHSWSKLQSSMSYLNQLWQYQVR